MLLLVALACVCAAQDQIFTVLFFSFSWRSVRPARAGAHSWAQFVAEGFVKWTVNGETGSPNITVARGSTVLFNMFDPQHVLAIHVTAGNVNPSDRYIDGVFNAGSSQTSWSVPLDAPPVLFYQCEVRWPGTQAECSGSHPFRFTPQCWAPLPSSIRSPPQLRLLLLLQRLLLRRRRQLRRRRPLRHQRRRRGPLRRQRRQRRRRKRQLRRRQRRKPLRRQRQRRRRRPSRRRFTWWEWT